MTGHGFIDLHTHGYGRYGTRDARPEDILKLAELLGKAGTAAFLPTIYPGPVAEMRADMEAVRKAMETQRLETKGPGSRRKASRSPAHIPSRILGVHLEGPFLNPAKAGALNRGSFMRPSAACLEKLTEGFSEIIRIMTVAPEMPGALKVIEKCAEAGIRVNMGHSDANWLEAREGKMAGAAGITHIFNAMRPFHHREPGIACFGLLDDDLYIETIADGVHLHEETLRLIFRIKRSDRIILVSDSVKGGRRGRPVCGKGGVLAGSGTNLSEAAGILKRIGVSDKKASAAAKENPREYLR
jgi:N-acetylglucosamine-6-phosphate deacetylase